MIKETPLVTAYSVSCVVRSCTVSKGCESKRVIRLAEILAPRRLKKNKIRLVKKIDNNVRLTSNRTALIPKIVA